MADVRALLKAERQSRRITHPNATYTSDGKLLCNLCEQMVKAEAAWTGHLHSTGHTLRTTRQKEAAQARRADSGNKKRKAADSPEVEEVLEDRKRVKSGNATPAEERGAVEELSVAPEPAAVPANSAALPAVGDVDADELAAFERELADLESMQAPPSALGPLSSGATISAAPLTAEELAAQAREEQSAQRGKRDAEIEAERDEAADRLQEEFEEMEGYEARVKRLREKREALRKGSMERANRAEALAAVADAPKINGAGDGVLEEEDEDDDDEEDDWFGGR